MKLAIPGAFFLLAALLVGQTGCHKPPPGVASCSFVDDAHRYAINFPQGWVRITVPNTDAAFAYTLNAPATSAPPAAPATPPPASAPAVAKPPTHGRAAAPATPSAPKAKPAPAAKAGPKPPAEKLIVTVTFAAAENTKTLDDFMLQARAKLSAAVGGYEETRSGVVDHPGGRKAYVLEGTCRSLDAKAAPDAHGVPVQRRFKQFGFLVGDRQCVVTLLGPAATAEQWTPQADPVLDSFLVW